MGTSYSSTTLSFRRRSCSFSGPRRRGRRPFSSSPPSVDGPHGVVTARKSMLDRTKRSHEIAIRTRHELFSLEDDVVDAGVTGTDLARLYRRSSVTQRPSLRQRDVEQSENLVRVGAQGVEVARG